MVHPLFSSLRGSCLAAAMLSLVSLAWQPTSISRRRAFVAPLGGGGVRQLSLTRVVAPSTRLFASMPDIETEKDPFKVLELEPTADKRQIKRAYKRMALKYHPDMVTNRDSTSAERKAAGERFAKINWAYETLTGKGSGGSASSTSYGGTSSTSSSTSSGWEPPHRRKGPYASTNTRSSTATSTDWRDYIPKNGYNDDEMYDTGGDSFGKIFADLLVGAAGAAASGGAGGIFKDFVEFLENNVDGASMGGDDAGLAALLLSGSKSEIADEMDDTQLLVNQLETKLRNLEDEVWTLQAELRQATRFSEKIKLEEEIEELQARQRVVTGYEKKARKRLVALQTRYKELLVSGRVNEPHGASSGTYQRYADEPRTYGSTSASSSSTTTGATQSCRGQRTDPSPSSSSSAQRGDNKDSWKTESFGSFGRRGSSRGRGRRARSTPGASNDRNVASSNYSSSNEPNQSTSPNSRYGENGTTSAPNSRSTSSTYSTSRETPQTPQTDSSSTSDARDAYVPPHRRTSSAAEDKRRLRDLKVDEEFDKLKRELGL